ncbi:hypothetical protein AAAC51_24505 [Priestia megaterium]
MLFNKPSAVIFPSGMAANIGILSVLATSEDVIINDRFNHISIFMGLNYQAHSYDHIRIIISRN